MLRAKEQALRGRKASAKVVGFMLPTILTGKAPMALMISSGV